MLAIVGIFLVVIIGTLLLFLLGTLIPFVVLVIRWIMGRRSTAAKVWMIVLGILTVIPALLLALIAFWISSA